MNIGRRLRCERSKCRSWCEHEVWLYCGYMVRRTKMWHAITTENNPARAVPLCARKNCHGPQHGRYICACLVYKPKTHTKIHQTYTDIRRHGDTQRMETHRRSLKKRQRQTIRQRLKDTVTQKRSTGRLTGTLTGTRRVLQTTETDTVGSLMCSVLQASNYVYFPVV